MLKFQLYRSTILAVLLLAFAFPTACGTLQVGVEGTNSPEAVQQSGQPSRPAPEPGTATITPRHGPQALDVELTQTVVRPIVQVSATPQATQEQFVENTATALQCSNIPVIEGQQVIPNLPDLRWEAVKTEIGALYRLAGLTSPVVSAVPSPDGHWFAAKVLRMAIQAGPSQTALFILDGSGEGHWLASMSGEEDFHDFDWLPDGRIVWVQDGFLALGTATGMERRDLAAPEPMDEVWVAAHNIIFASGKTRLWRLDLDGGNWELVMGLEEAVKDGQPPISHPGGNLAIAPDGSFAAANIYGSLYRIPIESGHPARFLASMEYGGRGGRIGAPRPLANSPYWYPGEIPLNTDPVSPPSVAMLDERTGKLVPLASLINIRDQTLFPPAVSPDGQWVAVSLANPNAPAAQALKSIGIQGNYLARSDQLALGRVIPGTSIKGWLTIPPGIFILDQQETGQALSRVLLPDGRALELISTSDQYLPVTVAATAKMAFVGAGDKLHAISLDEARPASLDLYGARPLAVVPPARGLVYGFDTQTLGNGQCTFMPALYLWDIR